jgi:flavin-binding protein dodecin
VTAGDDSVYVITGVVGTSEDSWAAATGTAIGIASRTLRDLRVGEVVRMDLALHQGRVARFRVRLGLSFKYEPERAAFYWDALGEEFAPEQIAGMGP